MKKSVEIDNRIADIERQTIADMQALTVYRDEFLPTIRRYACTRYEYELARQSWIDGGCLITGERKGANGYTTDGMLPEYKAMKQLREELIQLESQLGLTPSGLKRIKDSELKSQKKISRFEAGLNALQGQGDPKPTPKKKGK